MEVKNGRRQDPSINGEWLHRFSILAALKGLGNGINPRWWPRTVVVCRVTGEVIRVEEGDGRPSPRVNGRRAYDEREFTFYFSITFWLVVGFLIVSFLLWLSLPMEHRAVPVLERTWPPLLTGFAGLVFGRLA